MKTRTPQPIRLTSIYIESLDYCAGQFSLRGVGTRRYRTGREEGVRIEMPQLHRADLLCLLNKMQAAAKDDLKACNDFSKRFGVAHEWKP